MRMPKAARVAFDGEKLCVAVIAQAELLAPSRRFLNREHFSTACSDDEGTPRNPRPIISAVARPPLQRFRIRNPRQN
jgi:hypothetical protein